jgi:hypothetical protein
LPAASRGRIHDICVVTDSTGYYKAAHPYGSNFTATPSAQGCRFDPLDRFYAGFHQDYLNQDYTADCSSPN